jgi:hypothetical protein
LGDQIEKDEMGGTCSRYGIEERCIQGRRSLGRPRCKWENNIKMDHKEVGYGGMEWIKMAQDSDRWQALVNAVMNLWVP